MSYPLEQILKAARLAKPELPWDTAYSNMALCKVDGQILEFDPFNPAKGDLAALQWVLEDEWDFSRDGSREDLSKLYRACHKSTGKIIMAPTPAERAMRCVEVMG